MVSLLLVGNYRAARYIFARGNLHILDQGVHHDNATIPNPAVENCRSEPNKTIIPNKTGTIYQAEMGQNCALSNPDPILLSIGTQNLPLG
jgi:hypothetical protein